MIFDRCKNKFIFPIYYFFMINNYIFVLNITYTPQK